MLCRQEGKTLWIEAEPGVYFSPPQFATPRIETSDEFRRYAELSKAGLNPVHYLSVLMRQLREDIGLVIEDLAHSKKGN